MMNDQTRVTIGIATYHAAATVERAIASALSQTWDNTEIVVVDDASSDNTFALVQALASTSGKIRGYRNAVNAGVAAVRNRILREARGAYCCFFDDDDWSHPSRVYQQLRTLREFESRSSRPAVCYCARMHCSPEGRQRYLSGLDQAGGEEVALMILAGKPLACVSGDAPACCLMARTELLRDMGGFDEQLRRCEDTEWNLRFAQQGGFFVGVALPLVRQYQTDGDDKGVEKEVASWRYVLQKHTPFLAAHRLLSFSRQWVEVKFCLWRKQYGRAAFSGLRLLAGHPRLALRCLYAPLRRRLLRWRDSGICRMPEDGPPERDPAQAAQTRNGGQME